MQNDIPSRRDRVHSRRARIGATAAAGACHVAALEAGGASTPRLLPGTLAARFAGPDWNFRTQVGAEGDVAPGTQAHGLNTGTVDGALDGEALRPLFGFEVLSSNRLLPQADGRIQRLSLENYARTQKPVPESAR